MGKPNRISTQAWMIAIFAPVASGLILHYMTNLNEQPSAPSPIPVEPVIESVSPTPILEPTPTTEPSPEPTPTQSPTAEPRPKPEPSPQQGDSKPTANPIETSDVKSNTEQKQNLTVHEAQQFDLCGFTEFSAKLIKNIRGDTKIEIHSQDQSIPKIPTRGYTQTVSVNEPITLWEDCVVEFRPTTQALSSVIEILHH